MTAAGGPQYGSHTLHCVVAWLAVEATVMIPAAAVDNGLGLTPPMGWRSFNAFWGIINQTRMETIMDAMVNTSRKVNGKPTSLLDLGYNHVGLDGGWNYCFPENKSFHWASDGRPVWNAGFPDPQAMVNKAKQLRLSPGWYMNNCGCNENQFEGDMVTTIMEGSVKAVVEMGWEGLKLDSCSQFNNLSWWNELINETATQPILMENCHQGGFDPGMVQWQAYLRNSTTGTYQHMLGYFSLGHDTVQPINDTTLEACQDECNRLGCYGICFQDTSPKPGRVKTCYLKNESHFQSADLSYSNHCTGTTTVSDCPYNLYRTSGDIGTYWDRVLSNLDSTVPFLEGDNPMSRPGGWAYPDMLEVGRLRNFTESRTHFSAWAIMSSPLILSFDLRVDSVMDEMWPIISNRDVIAINQKWAGHPGTRLEYSGSPTGNDGNSSMIWAKPLGSRSYAVLFMSTGPISASFSLSFEKISGDLLKFDLCVRDVYSKADFGPIDPHKSTLNTTVLPHDSAFYCVRPALGGNCKSFGGCPAYD